MFTKIKSPQVELILIEVKVFNFSVENKSFQVRNPQNLSIFNYYYYIGKVGLDFPTLTYVIFSTLFISN